jgi:threonine synthase
MSSQTEHVFSGEVTRLDATAKTLRVRAQSGKKDEMIFDTPSGVKIMQSGKTKTLSEVKAGERVNVTYTGEGAKHEARRIELLGAQAKAASSPSKQQQQQPKAKSHH